MDTIEGDLEQAGQRVGDLMLTELFGLGYGGVVIVNSPKMSGVQYLQGVVDRIQPSKFEGRVFYTIDQEKDVVQVLEKLITEPTPPASPRVPPSGTPIKSRSPNSTTPRGCSRSLRASGRSTRSPRCART